MTAPPVELGHQAPSGPRAVVRTHGLSKRFGRVHAVRDLDLEVLEGDRFGFLGPNGSGKTTTVRMLLGLVLPTAGSVELFGGPVRQEALAHTGALVEGPAFYPHLSGRTNLRLFDAAGSGGARRTRRTRVGEALEQVGLAGVDRRPVKAYSLGMRQRLGLAGALLRRPSLLVLDEPTNGLDPQGIREVRELLLQLNSEGTTVVLSSHLLSEVEALCTRIAVMDRGRMVLQDSLAAFQAPTGLVELRTPQPQRAAALLGAAVERREDELLVVRSDDPVALNADLVGQGVPVSGLQRQHRSLEAAVLEVTGEGSDVRRAEPRRRWRRRPPLPAKPGRLTPEADEPSVHLETSRRAPGEPTEPGRRPPGEDVITSSRR